MTRSFPTFCCLLLISAIAAGVSPAAEPQAASASQNNASQSGAAPTGWIDLFDGKTLQGWHVSAKTGHSRPSKNTSGGRWVVEDGAIVGSQDQPGNGGIILTDREFGDFEVAVEMKNDFGPDSGLFLRSTEDGKAYQAMIDYHANGNLMGIYGEGLGGKPHIRNYSFKNTVTEIDVKPLGDPQVAFPVLADAWPSATRRMSDRQI